MTSWKSGIKILPWSTYFSCVLFFLCFAIMWNAGVYLAKCLNTKLHLFRLKLQVQDGLIRGLIKLQQCFTVFGLENIRCTCCLTGRWWVSLQKQPYKLNESALSAQIVEVGTSYLTSLKCYYYYFLSKKYTWCQSLSTLYIAFSHKPFFVKLKLSFKRWDIVCRASRDLLNIEYHILAWTTCIKMSSRLRYQKDWFLYSTEHLCDPFMNI